MKFIFLDSSPASLACQRVGHPGARDLRPWLIAQRYAPTQVLIPEIVDYEVRRELIRSDAAGGLRRLDALYADGLVALLPINSTAMRGAARLWAEVRKLGQPTADDRALDGDVILAAQALGCGGTVQANDWLILTENMEHIRRFVGDRARGYQGFLADFWRSSASLLDH